MLRKRRPFALRRYGGDLWKNLWIAELQSMDKPQHTWGNGAMRAVFEGGLSIYFVQVVR